MRRVCSERVNTRSKLKESDDESIWQNNPVIQTAFAVGKPGNRVIKKMIHPDDTRVLVVADGNIWLNPDTCQKSNQVVLAAGQLANDKVGREMLAILLSAQVAGLLCPLALFVFLAADRETGQPTFSSGSFSCFRTCGR